jgi:dTDP-4-dehydrorhamnose 3,5-epimerase
MREESPNYRKYERFYLSQSNKQLILIPPRYGNSFYVISEQALYHYKLAYDGDYIDADEQFTVAWNDSDLNIDWPCERPILSERDERLDGSY